MINFRLITPATPSVPTIATVSSIIDVGSALPTTNQYQTNLRVNPANTAHQAITCKNNTSETETCCFWTRDNWATINVEQTSSSGDPDCVWDNSGNLHYMYIGASAYGVWVKTLPSGSSTWNSPVSLGVDVDHPALVIDRSDGTRNGRIYFIGRTRNVPANQYIAYTDNQNTTWTGGTPWTSSQIPSPAYSLTHGGCVTPSGSLVFHAQYGSDATVYRTLEVVICRSTDGGATFANTPVYLHDDIFLFPGCGSTTNVTHDGSRLYVVNTKPVGGLLCPVLYYSDDDGVTWTDGGLVATLSSGTGIGNCFIQASPQVVCIVYYLMDNSRNYRVYFTWSTDKGATWKTPVEISTQSTPNGSPQTRYPGWDQCFFDMVGNTAFVAWPEGSSTSLYTVKSRTITFS